MPEEENTQESLYGRLSPSRLSHVAHTSRSANASQIKLLYVVADRHRHTCFVLITRCFLFVCFLTYKTLFDNAMNSKQEGGNSWWQTGIKAAFVCNKKGQTFFI